MCCTLYLTWSNSTHLKKNSAENLSFIKMKSDVFLPGSIRDQILLDLNPAVRPSRATSQGRILITLNKDIHLINSKLLTVYKSWQYELKSKISQLSVELFDIWIIYWFFWYNLRTKLWFILCYWSSPKKHFGTLTSGSLLMFHFQQWTEFTFRWLFFSCCCQWV